MSTSHPHLVLSYPTGPSFKRHCFVATRTRRGTQRPGALSRGLFSSPSPLPNPPTATTLRTPHGCLSVVASLSREIIFLHGQVRRAQPARLDRRRVSRNASYLIENKGYARARARAPTPRANRKFNENNPDEGKFPLWRPSTRCVLSRNVVVSRGFENLEPRYPTLVRSFRFAASSRGKHTPLAPGGSSGEYRRARRSLQLAAPCRT